MRRAYRCLQREIKNKDERGWRRYSAIHNAYGVSLGPSSVFGPSMKEYVTVCQHPPDWGEFLFKFDLGLFSLDLVILYNVVISFSSSCKCDEGGAQFSGQCFRGPYQGSSLLCALS